MNNKSKSIILDLLYGRLFNYNERIGLDDKCAKLIREEIDVEGIIYEKINGNAELTALFEKFIECDAVADNAEKDLYFTEGFKTGLLIGLEVGEWSANKKI